MSRLTTKIKNPNVTTLTATINQLDMLFGVRNDLLIIKYNNLAENKLTMSEFILLSP